MPRCPGQDLRFWTPKDIFDVKCFNCGKEIEFWKDEPMRMCPGCGREVRNPRIDLGCAKWCRYAKECLGQLPDAGPVPPVIDRAELLLDNHFADHPDYARRARRLLENSQQFISAEKVDACTVQVGALLAGFCMDCPDQLAADKNRFQTMLEKAGIESSVSTRILDIVLSALNFATHDSAEFAVICDVIAFENKSVSMLTQTGKQLASKNR